MSILQGQFGPRTDRLSQDILKEHSKVDERFSRDALGDLKHGLDLLFELKSKLDTFHPMASETLIRLISH